MNGLKVFGEDALQRIKICEFHFKENRNKMAQMLCSDMDTQEFKMLCDSLLMANIKGTYNAAKDAIYQFIQEKPEKAFLRAFSPSMAQAAQAHYQITGT